MVHQILLGWSDQGEKKMGGSYSTHGRDEKCILWL